MKLTHTQYMETLLELSVAIDLVEREQRAPFGSPSMVQARVMMDKVLSHHFDTAETIAMRDADIAAEKGGSL